MSRNRDRARLLAAPTSDPPAETPAQSPEPMAPGRSLSGWPPATTTTPTPASDPTIEPQADPAPSPEPQAQAETADPATTTLDPLAEALGALPSPPPPPPPPASTTSDRHISALKAHRTRLGWKLTGLASDSPERVAIAARLADLDAQIAGGPAAPKPARSGSARAAVPALPPLTLDELTDARVATFAAALVAIQGARTLTLAHHYATFALGQMAPAKAPMSAPDPEAEAAAIAEAAAKVADFERLEAIKADSLAEQERLAA